MTQGLGTVVLFVVISLAALYVSIDAFRKWRHFRHVSLLLVAVSNAVLSGFLLLFVAILLLRS